MKKLIAMLLALTTAAALTACSPPGLFCAGLRLFRKLYRSVPISQLCHPEQAKRAEGSLRYFVVIIAI